MRWFGTRAAGAALALTICWGCGDDSGAPAAPSDTGTRAPASQPVERASQAEDGSAEDLVEQGRRVYNVNCIACHHRDPTQDGGLGPAVAGASRELLEARVLRGEYPPGYEPKRDTRLMVPLRHLEPDIDALTAYLANPGS